MADILVSSSQWNEVSAEERDRIAQALRNAGVMKPDDNLAPSNEVQAMGWDPIKDLCKAACDAAAGAAIAWCTANTAGAATALCIAAANAAREECRRRC